MNTIWMPAILTCLALVSFIGVVIYTQQGDPLALARLGTRYSLGVEGGTEGYDGQFVYYMARDLHPEKVSQFLDVPAYRYQRILLPLLARALTFGQAALLPWILPTIGITAQTVGTWLVSHMLAAWGVNPWYALLYGAWTGLVLAIRLDLPEPLAFTLVIGAIYTAQRQKYIYEGILYGLAMFAKEVAILFCLAAGLDALVNRQWRRAVGIFAFALLPFGVFQLWLVQAFGAPGIGSGGAMATGFELIPLMGLFRTGAYSLPYLLALLVVFGPAIVVPAFWGVWAAGQKLVSREVNVVALALLINSLAIFFLPFSTFRETGGLLRFATGLVLSFLLFSGKYQIRRALRYAPLWLVLNVFLLKS